MKTLDFGEQWSSMERMFVPNTAIAARFREELSAAFLQNVRHFWESQEKILDTMQTVVDRWFERRRVETHKAREAGEAVCQFETVKDLFRTHRDWANGAFDRSVADAWSCQQQALAMIAVFGSLSLAASTSEKTTQRSGAKISAAANAA